MKILTASSPSGRLVVSTTARDVQHMLGERTRRWSRQAVRSLPPWLSEHRVAEVAQTEEIHP